MRDYLVDATRWHADSTQCRSFVNLDTFAQFVGSLEGAASVALGLDHSNGSYLHLMTDGSSFHLSIRQGNDENVNFYLSAPGASWDDQDVVDIGWKSFPSPTLVAARDAIVRALIYFSI